MKKLVIGLFAFALAASAPVFAQEAPAPHKAPRTPVHRQTLPENQAIETREVQGTATVIDSEHIKIGDVELRLFGVVPPQLSASFGPQARAALDQATAGKTVDCQIHDRDHDGHLLAICKVDNTDLGLTLLQHGLAVTARGSLSGTEWAQPYIAAEQAAMVQKLGLWAAYVPTPATVAAPAPQVTAAAPALVPAPVPAKIDRLENIPPPPAPADLKEEKPAAPAKIEKPAAKVVVEETKAKSEVAPVPVAVATTAAVAPKITPVTADVPSPVPGFIARYQILIAGLLMLTTALGIIISFNIRRSSERREEMRALAAALRGELMAARAVCQARLKTITNEADDRNTTWPRIRATLYQAYVGRLGALGAELARQIASIYGQTSDYAAYYATAEDHATMPKRQALETLTQHIEAVLPRLGGIEETGVAPRGSISFAAPSPVVTVASHAPTARIEPPAQKAVTGTTAEKPQPAAETAAAAAPAPAGNDKHYNRAASPIPLWKAMRNFTREKLSDKPASRPRDPMEDQFPDYAAMLDEDVADMSFTEGGDGDDEPPSNVTKFRAS